MLLGFKSRNTATALLAGIAVIIVGVGGWAYQFGFAQFATLVAIGKFSDFEIATFLFEYRNSISLFLLAVVLLLLAVAGTAFSAERIRKSNMAKLVHWMRHRGCPIDEDHALKITDDSMEELVNMVEALFPKRSTVEGTAMTRKEELEEFKSRFLELITHQLQTPLTSIRWNLEALGSGELGPLNNKQKEVLTLTDKNYEGILTMIGDWIEALDVERGFLRMNMEALDLNRYIDLVIEDYQHHAELKNIKISKSVAKNLPLVRADKAKLLFVLKKLFHNAVTYTHEGGTVRFDAKETGDYVRIEVQDSGVGIPYDEQQWIFKKFFRASNAALIEPNASGVGLFVAKTLVEAFGGQITFESEEGRGTTFIFTIPIAGPSVGVNTRGALIERKVAKKRAKPVASRKKSVKKLTAPSASVAPVKKVAKKKSATLKKTQAKKVVSKKSVTKKSAQAKVQKSSPAKRIVRKRAS